MVIFAGMAGLVSVVIGWLVTARLSSLAKRTGGAPERLLAITFGGLFCVGYPLCAASRVPGLTLTYEGSLLFAIGAIGIAVGIAALSRFPALVFRPGSKIATCTSALIALVGAIGALGATVAVTVAQTAEEMVAGIQPGSVLLMVSICVSFTWNAVESLVYYGRMKRRIPLGLATVDTTHRFLLWAAASTFSVVTVGLILALRGTGTAILSPLPAMIIASGTLVSSTCWWLAFFMPRFYRESVLGLQPEASPQGE